MSPNAALVLAVGGLVATGVYLLSSRHLTRVVLGVIVAGNGVNLLIISAAGRAGRAPVLQPDGEITLETASSSSDPLPQALVLTAIVITFAVTAFLLAVSYRTSRTEGSGGDDVVRDTSPSGRARGEATADARRDAAGAVPQRAPRGDDHDDDEDGDDGAVTGEHGERGGVRGW